MSARRQVMEVLERLAFAAELKEDPRASAYASAAWAVRSLTGELETLRANGDLVQVRGIGDGIVAIIDDVIAGRTPAALSELSADLPPGLFAISRIKGLGPKKVKALWKELAITSLGELEYACRENRLLTLKGFGKKTQASVLEQIGRIQESEGLLRRDQALRVVTPVLSELRVLSSVSRAELAGEWPRGLELVRDLAVVAATDVPDDARAAVDRARPPERAVALHTAPRDRFGAASVWWTSSEAHRVLLRERALSRGFVFDAGELSHDGQPVACPEEDDLYRALGLATTAVERREEGVPLVELGKARPALVTRADLRGALHNHTVESDGTATLDEMRAAAAACGLSYLQISEHSESAFYARGLDVARLETQRAKIAAMNADQSADAKKCALLTGVESDILENGALDYTDDVLTPLDLVIASAHRRFAQDSDRMTARMVAAAKNRLTDVIGHPTGRLLLGRAASELDMAALLDACTESGAAVELNANPHRLDLKDVHLAMAKERGVLVSIAADAHSTDELDHLDYGVTIARRAGLTAEDVLNARTADELRVWVTSRRAGAARSA